MTPQIIPAPQNRQPGGHYSQAIRAGGLIFVAGQLGITRSEPFSKPLSAQVHDVLEGLKSILAEAGACLEDVVKVSIFVDDIGYWDEIDAIYKTYFRDHRPARIIVPAKGLHFGSALEIEAIAVDKKTEDNPE